MAPAALRETFLLAHQHARRFSALFLRCDEFHDIQGAAAGTFVRQDSKLFVATAGHVLQDGNRDHTRGFAYLSDKIDDRAWKFMDQWQRGGREDVDEEWDLGCVVCHDRLMTVLDREPLEPSRIDATWAASPGGRVLLYGLSEDAIVETKHSDGKPIYTCHESGYVTECMAADAVVGATYRSEIDLFLAYPKESRDFEGNVGPPLSATGMSGGGVWALNMTPGRFWDPSMMRLVGVIRSSNMRHGWIRATHIKHWLELSRESRATAEAVGPTGSSAMVRRD